MDMPRGDSGNLPISVSGDTVAGVQFAIVKQKLLHMDFFWKNIDSTTMLSQGKKRCLKTTGCTVRNTTENSQLHEYISPTVYCSPLLQARQNYKHAPNVKKNENQSPKLF